VAGYCNLEFEGDALYLHEEDFIHNLTTNAVRLGVPPPLRPVVRSSNRTYVAVEGTFVAPRDGEPGYRGLVGGITRLERVPTRAELEGPGQR
jgi:hypothetical protein